jgi:hypothetical protein
MQLLKYFYIADYQLLTIFFISSFNIDNQCVSISEILVKSYEGYEDYERYENYEGYEGVFAIGGQVSGGLGWSK